MSESYGLDRVPDSLGFMILNEDGRVLKASGELVGQERIAGETCVTRTHANAFAGARVHAHTHTRKHTRENTPIHARTHAHTPTKHTISFRHSPPPPLVFASYTPPPHSRLNHSDGVELGSPPEA